MKSLGSRVGNGIWILLSALVCCAEHLIWLLDYTGKLRLLLSYLHGFLDKCFVTYMDLLVHSLAHLLYQLTSFDFSLQKPTLEEYTEIN